MSVVAFNVGEAEIVVQLACLTEERGADEQRALLAVAWSIDRKRMQRTTTNPSACPSKLVDVVLSSVDPHSDGAKVRLSAKREAIRQRMLSDFAVRA